MRKRFKTSKSAISPMQREILWCLEESGETQFVDATHAALKGYRQMHGLEEQTYPPHEDFLKAFFATLRDLFAMDWLELGVTSGKPFERPTIVTGAERDESFAIAEAVISARFNFEDWFSWDDYPHAILPWELYSTMKVRDFMGWG